MEELSIAVGQPAGNVTIAPRVLTELIGMTAHQVPGVARLGQVPPLRAPHAAGESGVSVRIVQGAVIADCYLVAAPDTNLLELGVAVQATVAAAIRELAGLTVREVNVYVQDVEVGHG
jgi:uncharacterized alkaline shock family protein YloU